MGTLVPHERHPALDLDEEARAHYVTVVAAVAWADRSVSDEERARLRVVGEALELPDEAITAVVDAPDRPPPAQVDELLTRLASEDLRYAILVDAVDIAYADDVLEPDEAAHIEALANRLEISPVQRELVRRYVAEHRSGAPQAANPTVTAALVGLGAWLASFAVAAAAGVALPTAAAAGAVLGAAGFVLARRSARAAGRDRD
jgi:uncharacterized tellurite resistance protein B-like protein